MRTLNTQAFAEKTRKLKGDEFEDDETEYEDDDDENEEEEASSDVKPKASNSPEGITVAKPGVPRPLGPWKSRFPALSQKEKKELRGHAHRLGKDLCLQHIGKWGVTENSLKCLGEVLEKNELMKVRILDNCPTNIAQVTLELEDGLEAQVVGKVGHVLLLYRPSLRKADKDEKNFDIAPKKKNRRSRSRQARQAREKKQE